MSSVAKIMRSRSSPEMEQRILDIKKDVWIGYERALEVRGHLDRLIAHPETNRMPCMALIGRSNNGKSMILTNFLKRHPAVSDPNAEKALLPVLLVTMPAAPSEGRLYSKILDKFGLSSGAREADESKLRRIQILLSHLETKMIIIDDFYNINGGTHTQRMRVLNALRNICIELSIPVVISGTPKIEGILSVDESISNRFRPVYLPTWTLDHLEEYARFVKTIEKHLKLANPMQLMSERALTQLMIFSDGLLGETVDILRLLAEFAIRRGDENIEAAHISKEYFDALGWVPPANRRVR